jgi:hypothetical protein
MQQWCCSILCSGRVFRFFKLASHFAHPSGFMADAVFSGSVLLCAGIVCSCGHKIFNASSASTAWLGNSLIYSMHHYDALSTRLCCDCRAAPAPAGEDEAAPATQAKGSSKGRPWSPKGNTQSAIDARFHFARSASGKPGVPKDDYVAPAAREGSASCAVQVGGVTVCALQEQAWRVVSCGDMARWQHVRW